MTGRAKGLPWEGQGRLQGRYHRQHLSRLNTLEPKAVCVAKVSRYISTAALGEQLADEQWTMFQDKAVSLSLAANELSCRGYHKQLARLTASDRPRAETYSLMLASATLVLSVSTARMSRRSLAKGQHRRCLTCHRRTACPRCSTATRRRACPARTQSLRCLL